jgi:hypothetical protein
MRTRMLLCERRWRRARARVRRLRQNLVMSRILGTDSVRRIVDWTGDIYGYG